MLCSKPYRPHRSSKSVELNVCALISNGSSVTESGEQQIQSLMALFTKLSEMFKNSYNGEGTLAPSFLKVTIHQNFQISF